MLQLIIALVLALTATTGGLAYAADDALPGQPLYGLDRAVEQLQLLITNDPQAEMALRLQLAEERLEEAQQLAERGQMEAVAELLQEYMAEVRFAQNALQLQVNPPSETFAHSVRRALQEQREAVRSLQLQVQGAAGMELQLTIDDVLELQLSIEHQFMAPTPPAHPQDGQPGEPGEPGEPDEPGELHRPTDVPGPGKPEGMHTPGAGPQPMEPTHPAGPPAGPGSSQESGQPHATETQSPSTQTPTPEGSETPETHYGATKPAPTQWDE